MFLLKKWVFMHIVSYFVSGTQKMMRTNYKYLA